MHLLHLLYEDMSPCWEKLRGLCELRNPRGLEVGTEEALALPATTWESSPEGGSWCPGCRPALPVELTSGSPYAPLPGDGQWEGTWPIRASRLPLVSRPLPRVPVEERPKRWGEPVTPADVPAHSRRSLAPFSLSSPKPWVFKEAAPLPPGQPNGWPGLLQLCPLCPHVPFRVWSLPATETPAME